MKITLGIVLSLLFIACVSIAYYSGKFSTSFNANMCYSNVIVTITDEVKSARNSDAEGALEELIRGLETLPLNGYESNCKEIKQAVGNLKQSKPHLQCSTSRLLAG